MSLATVLEHPEWVSSVATPWLLLALAVAAAWARARLRARRLGLAGPARQGVARDALLLAAALAVGLALLGPRIGTRGERLSTAGVDVVVLVDVSRSMDARDLPPSRLDRARQAAARLLAHLEPGDRAALAAFAGRGVLLTPLTPDHEALVDLLPALDTSLVQPAASRLGEGVRAALAAFDPGSERPRVLVVLSDGEDADAAGDVGLVEARSAGARVVAVALGSEAGATIPDAGLELRDRRGRIVTTRVDAARLAQLADATDGALLRPDALGAVDAAALGAAVRRDAPAPGSDTEQVERRVPAVRSLPFALAALALLALEAGAGLGARRGSPGPTAALLAALVLGAAASAPARGGAADGGDEALAPGDAEAGARDAHGLLARGLALAGGERWADAERAFLAAALAARDRELGADAYHDAGVAALRAGRLEAARDAFFESLALAPTPETRFNLEWTLRALAAAPPPPAGDSEPTGEADEAPTRPEPDPGAPPPAPPARADAEARRAPAPRPDPPPMSADEAERLLAKASDDPGLALRGLREERTPRTRGSAW
ncbi:MAG TPA: VWA domain-containing protein [Myxococcota bacterium]|nr:VWA domain-containing protein [Myxococcota bacterium]